MSEQKKQSRIRRLFSGIKKIFRLAKRVWNHPLTRRGLNWVKAYRRPLMKIFAGIVIIFAIGYTISALKVDADEAIEQFAQGLEQEDPAMLQSIIELDQVNLSFREQEAKRLIRLSQQQKELFFDTDGLIAQLQQEQQKYENTVIADPASHNKSLFYLKKKDGFLWDQYAIGLRAGYIKIKTSIAGTQVWIDQKPVKMNGTQGRMGPLLPGIYKLTGSKKYPYTTVTVKRRIEYWQTDNQSEEYLLIDGETIPVYSKIPDTEVLINGKKTGQKVGNTYTEFGPVKKDGSLQVTGERKFTWGVLKSSPIKVTSDVYKFDLTPNPFSSEQIKKQLIEVINRYAKERVQAMQAKSVSPYTALDEVLKKKYETEFQEQKKFYMDNPYHGKAIETIVSTKNATVTEDQDGQVKFKIPVRFHYLENKRNDFGPYDETLKDQFEESYVWLIYNEQVKEWKITNFDMILYSDDLFKGPDVITTKL